MLERPLTQRKQVLGLLVQEPGVTVKEIAEKLSLTIPGMSSLLTEMYKQKQVQRGTTDAGIYMYYPADYPSDQIVGAAKVANNKPRRTKVAIAKSWQEVTPVTMKIGGLSCTIEQARAYYEELHKVFGR